MAYAYDACYGYYIDPNGTAPGTPGFDGLYTTDNNFVVTDDHTLYILPETLQLPSPNDPYSNTSWIETMAKVNTLTEFDYAVILPRIYPLNNDLFTMEMYEKVYHSLELIFPGAFIYCRSLLYTLGALYHSTFKNSAYNTFVWLTDINIIIDYNGRMYSVDPDTDLITQIGTGSILSMGANFTSFNVLTNPARTTGSVSWYVNFRLKDSSWYWNSGHNSAIRDVNDETVTNYWTLWSSNTASGSNYINPYLIGTPSDPKYKYKTDPENHGKEDPYTPPFTPLTPSGPGGGDGTHIPEHDGDPAPIPDITQLPSILDSTFITAWHVTPTQLNSLGAYLWSTNFWGLFSNIFINPFDVLIGLTLVPVAVTDNSTAETIKFGLGDSLVVSHRITTQFYEIDCGGFICDEIWGSYLDYQVRFQLYLPFIGYRPIQAVDVVGHTLSLKYHVDVITGSCIAYVMTDDYCTYTFTGTCAYNLPLTGQSFSQFIASAVSLAGSYAAAALAPESMAGAAALNVAGSTMNTLGTRPEYSRSGGMGGNSAFMGMRKPILLSYVPRACVPKDQNKIMGYPSYQTKTLSQVSGYTELLKVHLDGITATDAEKNEIESYLIGGVIL